MEDTLRVAMSVGIASKENVLILVLMEDTLRVLRHNKLQDMIKLS